MNEPQSRGQGLNLPYKSCALVMEGECVGPNSPDGKHRCGLEGKNHQGGDLCWYCARYDDARRGRYGFPVAPADLKANNRGRKTK